MDNNQIINVSICFDDLKTFMNANAAKFPQAKNGKTYVNLTVKSRKEPDVQGNDCSVSIGQTKDERAAKAPLVYVGAAKTFTFAQNNNSAPQQQAQQYNSAPSNDSTLPF